MRIDPRSGQAHPDRRSGTDRRRRGGRRRGLGGRVARRGGISHRPGDGKAGRAHRSQRARRRGPAVPGRDRRHRIRRLGAGRQWRHGHAPGSQDARGRRDDAAPDRPGPERHRGERPHGVGVERRRIALAHPGGGAGREVGAGRRVARARGRRRRQGVGHDDRLRPEAPGWCRMSRTPRAALTALALALLIGACGGHERTSRELPPARAVDITGCSPITYGGKGRPELLIGVSTILAGQFREHGIQISQALRMVLGDRDWHAGDFNVGLQICGETTPAGDAPDPKLCRRTAHAFARNRSVVAVLGQHFSSCGAEGIPILNGAAGGPVPQVSVSATYLGLTRAGPGVARGDPARFHPSGTRSFARLVPPDDVSGAAAAMFAKQQGAGRVYALDDGQAFGFGVAEAFAEAARRIGLRVAGREPVESQGARLPAPGRSGPCLRRGRGLPRRLHLQQRTAADQGPPRGARPARPAHGPRCLQRSGRARRGRRGRRGGLRATDRRAAERQASRAGPRIRRPVRQALRLTTMLLLGARGRRRRA